ncbi:hypothetical protein A2U01_0083206, partial [Trifolium medium]|nr:hypothetical protein [Trifolium medium]
SSSSFNGAAASVSREEEEEVQGWLRAIPPKAHHKFKSCALDHF